MYLPIGRNDPVYLRLGFFILLIVHRAGEAQAVPYILAQWNFIWLHPQLDAARKLCNIKAIVTWDRNLR